MHLTTQKGYPELELRWGRLACAFKRNIRILYLEGYGLIPNSTSIKIALAATLCASFSLAQAQSPHHVPYNLEEARQEVEAALDLDADVERGRKVYEVCAVCHLPEGWGSENGLYPQLAGQHPSVTIKQLADIRARNRDNPTMRPFASPEVLGGIQQIADVAAYIAALPMSPRNSVGPGRDLERGGELYQQYCAECHGDQGQGDPEEYAPRLHGQHYPYLVRQFEWIRQGKRRNASSKMGRQVRELHPRDERLILDYISRLSPPAEMVAETNWQNPDFPGFVRGSMGMPYGRGATMPPMMPPMPPMMPPRPPQYPAARPAPPPHPLDRSRPEGSE